MKNWKLRATYVRKIKFKSPLPINTFVNIYKVITNMTYFKFNNKFYKQKHDLPMGNPLCRVLACLFLEFLESAPFKYRLLSNTTYFRYIDDIHIILPQNIKIEEITEKLNHVEPTIYFTYEKESINTAPILDIIIIKSQKSLTFKVTNKNDCIHSYTHHNNKIKNWPHNRLLPWRTQYMLPTKPWWRIWVHRHFTHIEF